MQATPTLTLTLTLETPFLPGSADPNKVDLDWPLRPSEVKGIWRWWARAFVAGALFKMGYLCDCEKREILKEQARLISLIVGKGLGLGYAGQNTSQASEFEVFVEPIDNLNISKFDSYSYYCEGKIPSLQRVNLLMISKTIYNSKKDIGKIKILFSNNIKDDEIEISRGVLRMKDADEVKDGDSVIMKTNRHCEKLRVKINESENAFIRISSKYSNEKVGTIRVYKELEYIDPSSNFTVNLRVTYKQRSGDENEEDAKNKMIASLGILLTALTLSCFGKGGRKGLGCFSMERPELKGAPNDVINTLNSIINDLKSSNVDKINNAIDKVRSYVEKVVQKFIKDKKPTCTQARVPPIPAVIPNRDVSSSNNRKAPLFKVMIAEGKSNDALLVALHNFFLGNFRQKYLKRDEDKLTKYRNSWILGLPRTGYGDERRPSPIFIAIHGNKAYITVFTSCDWPKRTDEIIDAIATAIDELEKYAKANNNINIFIK